jgi:hypothetical protein
LNPCYRELFPKAQAHTYAEAGMPMKEMCQKYGIAMRANNDPVLAEVVLAQGHVRSD